MKYKNAVAKLHERDDYDESYIEQSNNPGIIKQWDINAIGAEEKACGLSGSPTKVKAIYNVVLQSTETKIIPNTDDGIRNMIHELVADHILS